jgi:hypothetical protein
MPQISNYLKIKNHFASSDELRRKVGRSDKARSRTSLPIDKNPLERETYTNPTKARYLLICRSCLWCASCINRQATYTKCPLCHNGEIDCMRVGEDHNCLFDYSHSKDFELKFANIIRCWQDIEYRVYWIIIAYWSQNLWLQRKVCKDSVFIHWYLPQFMSWQERHHVRSDTSLWETIEVYYWWNRQNCGYKRNSRTENDIGSITVIAIDFQGSVSCRFVNDW